MATTGKIELNKLGAAKLQLETAIWLYFHNGDPVSIHTLAAAAVESIRPAAKKRGVYGFRNYAEIVVAQKHQKRIFDILKEAENFFKHGGFDQDKTLVFDPGQTVYVLVDGCLMYEGLAAGQTTIMRILTLWFIFNNPDVCNPTGEFGRLFKEVCAGPIPTREKFFTEACKALAMIGLPQPGLPADDM